MSDGCRESNALLMSVECIPINCSESTASFQSSVSLSKVSLLCFFPVRRYAGIELGIKMIIHLYAHHRLKTLSTVLRALGCLSWS